MHTSRCISPDYAAENGQGCFGIVTALLAKENRTKQGWMSRHSAKRRAAPARPNEPGRLVLRRMSRGGMFDGNSHRGRKLDEGNHEE
jgi:hypothetical protein